MKRMVTFFALVALGYAGICLLVFLLQGRMLFFPRISDSYAVTQLERWQRTIESSEATLSGWFIPARDPSNAPLVFYFGDTHKLRKRGGRPQHQTRNRRGRGHRAILTCEYRQPSELIRFLTTRGCARVSLRRVDFTVPPHTSDDYKTER